MWIATYSTKSIIELETETDPRLMKIHNDGSYWMDLVPLAVIRKRQKDMAEEWKALSFRKNSSLILKKPLSPNMDNVDLMASITKTINLYRDHKPVSIELLNKVPLDVTKFVDWKLFSLKLYLDKHFLQDEASMESLTQSYFLQCEVLYDKISVSKYENRYCNTACVVAATITVSYVECKLNNLNAKRNSDRRVKMLNLIKHNTTVMDAECVELFFNIFYSMM